MALLTSLRDAPLPQSHLPTHVQNLFIWCGLLVRLLVGSSAIALYIGCLQGRTTSRAAVSQSVSDFTVPPRAHPSTGSQAGAIQLDVSVTGGRGKPLCHACAVHLHAIHENTGQNAYCTCQIGQKRQSASRIVGPGQRLRRVCRESLRRI